jgi:hypothetical protein
MLKLMKYYRTGQFVLAALLSGAFAANAALITEPTRSFAVGSDIADIQNPPLSFLQSVTDSAIVSLTRVDVGLHLVGTAPGLGFASEMYVALHKDLDRTSILLNRVGVSSTDLTGAGYDGWDVTFSDSALRDIHLAALDSGVLDGAWAPDGRSNPAGSIRSQMLSNFVGGSGNGDWRLAIADLEQGGTMRLESWSLSLSGYTSAVPEPSTAFAGFGAIAMLGLFAWRNNRSAVARI